MENTVIDKAVKLIDRMTREDWVAELGGETVTIRIGGEKYTLPKQLGVKVAAAALYERGTIAKHLLEAFGITSLSKNGWELRVEPDEVHKWSQNWLRLKKRVSNITVTWSGDLSLYYTVYILVPNRQVLETDYPIVAGVRLTGTAWVKGYPMVTINYTEGAPLGDKEPRAGQKIAMYSAWAAATANTLYSALARLGYRVHVFSRPRKKFTIARRLGRGVYVFPSVTVIDERGRKETSLVIDVSGRHDKEVIKLIEDRLPDGFNIDYIERSDGTAVGLTVFKDYEKLPSPQVLARDAKSADKVIREAIETRIGNRRYLRDASHQRV